MTARINPRDATWQAVVSRAEEEIENLRRALERDADEKTTAKLRGKIAAYRSVLTWPENGQTTEPNEGIEFT